MLQWLTLFCCICHASVYGIRHRQQTFSQILSVDWDIRYKKVPPFREFVDIDEDSQGDTKTLSFKAFGKNWKVSVELNKVIHAKNFEFWYTDVNGGISKKYGPLSNCFFVGTATAGANENGLAAITSCGGTFRGYIITNTNDYMINVPIPISSYLVHIPRGDFTGENETYGGRVVSSTEGNALKRGIEVIPKATPITGRMSYVETALFFDKSFQDRFQQTLGFNTENDLRMYAMEMMNYAQLWYLHHTLGYRLWFIVHKVVILNGKYPNSEMSFQGACKWHQETFKETRDVDQAFVFTGTTDTCSGMGGAAYRNSACGSSMTHRCACIHDQNFHSGDLIRTFTHEAAHPLGMPDDYNAPTNKICYTGIMRWGVYEDRDWSTCSIHSLDRFLHVKDNDCLQRQNTPGLPWHISPNTNVPLNVAWRAPAVQSSTYVSDKVWGAWKATDGPFVAPHPKNMDPALASCTHTLKETDPWIRVDIGEASGQYIDSIDVYNREDCCDKRLSNFEVRVGNSANIRRNTLCYHHKGSVPGGKYGMVRIKCTRAARGRYVSVQLRGHNKILSVCDIGVNQYVQPKDMDTSSNPCYDNSRFCYEWDARCSHDARTRKECQLSCGLCKPPGTPVASSRRLNTEYPSTEKPGCKDVFRNCYHHRANGRCGRWASQCPRSCNAECQEEEIQDDTKDTKDPKDPKGPKDSVCKDDEGVCPSWADVGHCKLPHVRDMCKHSCGVC